MAKSNLHGLLLVDKPGRPLEGAARDDPLPTSHDIVKNVRRWGRQGRIGHTGTLDPMASGLLLLCLGVATRLAEYYQGHDKIYEAEVTLGSATDTYDAEGQPVRHAPVPALSESDLQTALDTFRGEIWQKPPVYSALKQGGESLHRKARRGEAVDVPPRQVTIHTLELLAFHPPDRIRLRVGCSAGTYIRSLAHDLGEALGTAAHLSYLRRLQVGTFSVAAAHPLPAIAAAAENGHLPDLLLPPGTGLEMPRILLSAEQAARLGHGQKIELPAPVPSGGLAAACDADGRFLGVVRALSSSPNGGDSAQSSPESIQWKAEKWLAQQLT